jgi:1,4-dihydroxy-2-naphthoate octaprenyltransferase
MSLLSGGAYLVGIAVGIFLVLERGSTELFVIGIAGVLLSVFYTAPPLKLVHRGLGELTTAVGFGPIMVRVYVCRRRNSPLRRSSRLSPSPSSSR